MLSGGRNLFDLDEIQQLINNLKSFSRQTDGEQTKLLAMWEFFGDDTKFQIFTFGIEPKEKVCEKLVNYFQNISVKSEAYLSLAKELIEKYEKNKSKLSHREKRRYLEDAIDVLQKIVQEAEKQRKQLPNKNKIYLTIAKAYLLRSKIYRPKGMTIPERKKEALRKALEWVEKVNFGILTEAYLVKSEIYLELERTGKSLPEDAETVFEKALNNCSGDPDIIAQIAVHWAELKNDANITKKILKTKVLNQKNVSSLKKAKAAFLLGDDNTTKQHLNKLCKEIRNYYFSNPLWDDSVIFLKQLRKNNNDLWKQASIDIWEVCEENVRNASTLHIRWYWSRQRDLYDLAFLAAKDIERKVKIADSLKSRPSLSWKAWEQLDEAYVRQEESALDNKYIKRPMHKKANLPLPMQFNFLPKSWIAIHFYLNRLEKKGYALILEYDDNNGEWKWRKEQFEFLPIFDAFEVWQHNYFERKIDASPFLEQLCKKIGEKMTFLFELPEGKPVLFITHDFLHRLPLHAAINEKDEFFLEKHPSMYLPAWGFVRIENKTSAKGRILLKNFDGYDFKNLLKKSWTKQVPKAKGEDLTNVKEPPELLVILCHGIPDLVNPFRARLELAEGGVTFREILRPGLQLTNSKVLLGACETELVPPLGSEIDEHLSISSSFLIKGAREILGALWRVKDEDTEELIGKIIGISGPMCKILNEWQKEQIREVIYNLAPFRVIGAPK